MSGQCSDHPVPVTHPLATRPWWQLAVLAAIVATVANFAIFAIAAGPAGLAVRELGPVPLSLLAILAFSVVPTVVATMLAAGLARWTGTPRRWFVGIAVVVLLLSLVPPPFFLETSVANLLMLELMHVAAAAVIVATLTPRLANHHSRR